MRHKYFILFLLLSVMIFCLVGCGADSDSQKESGQAYSRQPVVSDWIQAGIHRVVFQNDVVYFTTYEEIGTEDGVMRSNNRLYSVDKDGNNLEEIPIDLTKEDPFTMITSIIATGDDTVSFWLSSIDAFEKDQINVYIKVDDKGKELMRKDLNTVVNGQYINKALQTTKGQIIAQSDSSVYIFDKDLELLNEIDMDDHLIGLGITKEDHIFSVSENDDGKQQIQMINTEKGNVSKTILLNKGENVAENALFNGFQYDFCYRNENGIYSYDLENKKSICLMDYEKSNLVSEDIVDGISVGENFMLIEHSQGNISSSIAIYTKPDVAVQNDKTTITFGAFQFDEQMKRAVLAYNKASTKYQIALKEYFDEDSGDMTADEAIQCLNQDIAKGEVPDILDLSFLTEQYASKGIFEDLMIYIEKDDELSEELFVDSVFQAMKQGDKLYYISPDFGISTLIGKTEYEEAYTGWSMEMLIAFCEEQDDKMPFYAETKMDLLDILLQGGLGEFCDWENGKCQFDSQEFIDILTFCDLVMQKDNSLEPDATRDELIKQGKVLWIDASDFVPQDITSYSKLLGGEIAYMGYPDKEGVGSYFALKNCIGIASASDVKDGAWDFIRTLLSYEYQEQYVDFNQEIERIPLREDCFDLLMDRLTNPKEDTEDLKENDDILSSQQKEVFCNLVANTHKTVSYDIEMMNIIEEEAQAYFVGEKEVNEVVSVIQNRCTTYMAEKR